MNNDNLSHSFQRVTWREREWYTNQDSIYKSVFSFFNKNMKFKFSKYLKYLKCKEGERDTNTQRERKREAQQWENSNKRF